MSRTAPQGWLKECIAPSPFWKAVEPMEAATCMRARAGEVRPVRDGVRERLADEAHALEGDPLRERVEHGGSRTLRGSGRGRPSRPPRLRGGGQPDGELGGRGSRGPASSRGGR